jgi:prevent-host-death family protein
MARKKQATVQAPGISFLMAQPREVGAAEFKARCLELISEVERSGAEIVITKHRRAVARLVPARASAARVCGALKGMVIWEGDIVSPIDVEWEADESNLT